MRDTCVTLLKLHGRQLSLALDIADSVLAIAAPMHDTRPRRTSGFAPTLSGTLGPHRGMSGRSCPRERQRQINQFCVAYLGVAGDARVAQADLARCISALPLPSVTRAGGLCAD